MPASPPSDVILTWKEFAWEHVRAARAHGISEWQLHVFEALSYGYGNVARDAFGRRCFGIYFTQYQPQCDAAIDECFANGWIQVLTEQAIQGIVHALKSNGTVPGNPLHTYSSLFQFPDCADGIGCVDFTRNGAQVYLDLLAQRTRCWDPHDAWGAWDVLDSRDPVLLVAYGESEAAIDRLTESLLREDCEWIQPRAQPEPMGRWCAQWWRCFETGVRVELTAKFTPQARINYSLDDDDRNCVTV